MISNSLLAELGRKGIQLRRKDDDLLIHGGKEALDDPLLVDQLRINKASLLRLVRAAYDERYFPTVITPDMLPLVSLDQEEIDRIVAGVPGGAANVQDVYPLAPLQEGILFHHTMATEGDIYLLPSLFAFDSRQRLDSFLGALQAVIARHDALRTSVVWEGVREPVQVVWRDARIVVEEIRLAGGDVAKQLRERFDGRRYRLDVTRAPLMHAKIARDEANDRWLAMLLIHHLAVDHESLGMLLHEVNAHVTGQQRNLPTPLPFRNFVAQTRFGITKAEHEAFFKEMLGDVEEPTLPFDLANVQGDAGATLERREVLDRAMAQRIRERSRSIGVSASSVFHMAWAQVLSQVTGHGSVVFGTVLLGRMYGGETAGRVLGLCTNTLPICVRFDDRSVLDTLRQTHSSLSRLLRHEHASLVLAQRCSGVPATQPLFSSLLNYRHSEVLGDPNEGARLAEGTSILYVEERTNYPLTFSVDESKDAFAVTVQVPVGQDARRIGDLMTTSLVRIVEALERSPSTPARSIDVVPEAERRRVVEEFNATEIDYPRHALIHELFEAQVAKTPDALAVAYRDQRVTYEELNRHANQLARYLRARGVGPDCPVAICVERSIEMVVGLLGVLKAGGAYVPLDPSYPADRLEYMLEDSAPRVLLTQERLRRALPQSGPTVIALDGDWSQIATQEASNVANDIDVTARHLAYVIYTSGSTGRPKGVMVPHAGVVNFLVSMSRQTGLSAQDRLLAVTTLSFDIAGLEIYLPLVCGAQLLLMSKEAAADATELMNAIDKQGVTLLQATPATWQLLLGGGWGGSSRLTALCGGEALSGDLADRIRRRVRALWNMYGPTETTIWSCAREIALRADGVPAIESIGRPIANTQVYILDERQRPVPIGVSGEIYIGGAGVARGYLRRPELTSERFSRNPFDRDLDARMYRTGDLGRWRPDGDIDYLGRNDLQVKIRGFRIELGEIEAQLRRHAEVEQAVVLVREDTPGDKRIVAYMTHRGLAPGVEELRAHLRATLPEYMIPVAFKSLERLPLTPNGKVDRKALPAPDRSASSTKLYEAPQGTVEEAIAGVWQELLHVEGVGRQDNFFELGGNSLLVIQVMERLRRVGLSAEVRLVFASPTLADLASALTGRAVERVEIPPNSIPPGCESITPEMLPLIALDRRHIERIVQAIPGGASNIQDIYPLAPPQEGLVFHHVLHEHGGDLYVRPILLSSSSRERLEELAEGLQGMIDRHDVLRTAILWEQLPQPVQVVCRRATLTVKEIALDPARDSIAQLEDLMRPENQKLDLRQAPLMCMQIAADTRGDRWYALLQIHHVVFDHESLAIMFAEMTAYAEGRAPQLPEPVPYRNHVAQTLADARKGDAEAFFRDKLADVDEPTAPYGLLDVHADGSSIVEGRQSLDGELVRRIHSQARRLGTSAATLFHAAWALVVSLTSGRSDVVYGSTLLGRLQGAAGAQLAVGMFVNTLPLRLKLEGASTEELVRQTQRELAELMNHERASLALAQKCSGVAESAPLFTAQLNYRRSAKSLESQVGRTSGLALLATRGPTNFPIALSVDDQGARFVLETRAHRQIDPRRVLEYVATAIESLICALETAPQTPALALAVLPASERRQIVEEFNDTRAAYPQDKLIHGLFEEQAQRTPKAIALVCEGEALTYEELNGRANQLARYLRKQGVGRGERVAIFVERSAQTIAAILAALKSGAAYVPLDASAPAERLAYVLGDVAPRVLLTQQDLRSRLPVASTTVVALDTRRNEIAGEDARNLESTGVDSRDLAYVMYTSGSTGQPKGVMVEHAQVINLWQALENGIYAALDAAQVVSVNAPLTFDASVKQLVQLLSGRTLAILPDAVRAEPDRLWAYLARRKVAVLDCTPSVLEAAIAANVADRHGYFPAALLIGGEAIRPELWNALARLPDVAGFNVYGPTECTVDTTIARVRMNERPHIGRPIANARTYLLDRYLRPVPIGVEGELYIGGAGVARGYLRPELTAERFIPDPFSAQPGARLYRTGDLGRYRPDGNTEYLGRNDQQVKIRGFRIELGEVEAQLLRHPHVKEAVVIARADTPGDKQLVAYVTASRDAPPAVKEIRAHLKGSLPDYMLPAAFVVLETLPLTQNGKLDRKNLPAPDGQAYVREQYVAPRTPTERVLVRIWSRLLRLPENEIGCNENFLSLGGHSLLIVRMISALQEQGLQIDARTVLASASLAELAQAIDRLTGQQAQRYVPPENLVPEGCEAITPEMLTLVELTQAEIDRIVRLMPGGARNVQDVYPLAPLQEGLLFHSLVSERGDAYVKSTLLAIESRAQLEAFLRALQAVNDRHDLLRTGFFSDGLSQAVQVVYRHAEIPVEQIDLSRDRDPVEQMRARMTQPLRMDVRIAPLSRIQIARDPDSSRWYVLLWRHHLISDHVGSEITMAEIAAHLTGRADQLTTPVPYRRFVDQSLTEAGRGDAEEFFRGKFGTVDEPTAPFGLLDVRGDGTAIDETTRPVTKDLAKRVRAVARHSGVSAATLFHAAWTLVTARTSGRDDVVFGSVLSGRMQDRAGIDDAVGVFINTLPLRIRIDGASAEQVVRQVQQEIVELLPYERASLALAQHCSGIHRGAPLFTAVLNYRHTAVPGPDSRGDGDDPGVQILGWHLRTNYPLMVAVDDLGADFSLTAQVERPILPDRVIEYLLTAIESLVTALERAPETPVSQLEVLPASERRRIIEQFNDTRAVYPRDKLIHELFEEQVERTPHATALVYEEEELTYEELNGKANQLARYLRKQGVARADRVAIFVERSAQAIVAMLAVLKTGAAYVPLDSRAPAERLGYLLDDVAPKLVLTQKELKTYLPATSTTVVSLDAQWNEVSGEKMANLDVSGLGPGDLAYVMYTSGSTGEPKGVMVGHGSIVNYATHAVRQFDVAAGEGSLIGTSLNFDLSLTGLYPPLICGKSVRVCAEGGDLARLLLEGRNYSPVKLTPTHLAMLSLPDERKDGCVRTLVVGGEQLREGSLQWWRKHSPSTRIFNHYGPTETTIGCVVNEVLEDDEGPVPIGRPISNTQIYILDRQRSPVPIGVVGEIYIGGAGVARGYWNRPALTAQCFVRNPFAADPEARMYKTGDLGRWRADGKIDFLGRNDHQVKIRGFRIELGEIEAQLQRHPHVKEGVVIAREDLPGETRLVAYLTAPPDVSPSVEEIRAHLKGNLPDYMLPSAFVVLEALPLTQNGKLDRRSLPAPDPATMLQREYEAPREGIEEVIADIWRELLNVERVSRNDNFFDLGGHSLMATRLESRIRQVLGRELPLRHLFESPTVQALASRLSAAGSTIATTIPRVGRNRSLPLSWSQLRLWFFDQLSGNGAAYNIYRVVRLRGKLNRPALRAALDTIIKRHEVLRTVFVGTEDPVQMIGAPASYALEIVDLSTWAPEDREAEVRRQEAEEEWTPFNLSAGPLIRGRLLRLGDEEHVWLTAMHHIVSDGWSLGILIREFVALYGAYTQGLPDPLPELQIQYADYAMWQREFLQGGPLRDQLAYWKPQLTGAPALLELPTDRPRPQTQRHRGNSVFFSLAADLSRQLKRLSRQHDVTLFMTLFTGFAVLLSRLSGQEDIVIGSPVANRQREDIEGLIGCFINTLALRVQLSDSSPISGVLDRVKTMTLAAYGHQDAPFEQVLEQLQPTRSLSHSPLFQVMLALQNMPQAEFKLPGLTVIPETRSSSSARFDLILYLEEVGDEMIGQLNYSTDLFDLATIERWLEYFKVVLAAMVQDMQQPVGGIALLGGREQEVRRLANLTEAERFGDRLHGRFVEKAIESPERIALEYEGGRMTYGELLGRSSALAQRLIERGARRNELIGVVLDKGWEQVVAVLGILLSGAAYLPIDPRWPVQRRVQLLEQGEARMVVTRKEVGEASEWPVGCERIGVSREDAVARVEEIPAARQGIDDLAYVIFTSGSTGTPKGVVIDHKSAVNTVLHINRLFEVGQNDKVLAVSELSFDLSVYDIFGVLAAGGTVVIPEPALARDPNHWLELIRRHGVTIWNSVPQLMSMLVEVVELERTGRGISPLRLVLMSGDWIPVRLPGRIKAQSPLTKVISLGGATEGSVWSIYYPIEKVDPSWESIPYGKALPNQHMYVLNKQLQPCPEAVAGDIYIGGTGVALGYWKNEMQTQAQFMEHPQSGERLYKTGDLGRFKVDGNIEFLGRNDKQVKIRGFRIELGEIESQLNRHPAVKEAVVIVREDAPGEKRLAAYFTANGEAPPVEQLRSHLKDALPDYMVPNAFVLLDALPLTPNGKLDRNALPVPDALMSKARVEPTTDAERALVEIWQDALGVEGVGVTDNFFAVGGHSLVAVKMLKQMERAVGAAIALRDVFRFPTIGELATAAARGLHSLRPPQNPCLIRNGNSRPVFFAHTITGETDAYVALANLLAVDAPAYGLHILDQKPGAFRDMSMKELALYHVRAMQNVQPEGPYRIAGYSAGGLLAYAIACELRDMGETVEFVGLIDANDVSDVAASDDVSVEESIRLTIRQYSPGLEEDEYAEMMRTEPGDSAEAFFARSQEAGHIPERFTFEDVVDRADYFSILLRMAHSYVPPPLDAKVHLFVCADTMKKLRWKEEIAEGWETHPIGGNHLTLIHPPFLAGLAGLISRELACPE